MKIICFIIGFLLSTVFVGYGQSSNELIKKGNTDYQKNDFANSEINYRKALEKEKGSVEANFNLGDALYKQGKFEESASQFNEVISQSTNDKVKSKAYHNLGNSLLKSKKYQEAVDAYKNALKKSPGDGDSKYNLAYAKNMLVQQQQQQQQQNNKDKKDNKDQKDKDQNNKDQDNKDNQNKKDEGKKDQDKKGENKKDEQEGKDPKEKEQEGNQKPDPEKISTEDAQRMLDALNNKEKDLQKKASKKQGTKVLIEKNW